MHSPAGVRRGAALHAGARALPGLGEVPWEGRAEEGALLAAAAAAGAARLPPPGHDACRARGRHRLAVKLRDLCAHASVMLCPNRNSTGRELGASPVHMSLA